MTSASHPKMAVLRWRALQRPARAAMPPLGMGLICNLSSAVWTSAQRPGFRGPSQPVQPASAGGRTARSEGAVDRTPAWDQTRRVSGLAVPKIAGVRREARALPRLATPALSPGLSLAIWSATAAAVVLVVWGALFGDEHVAGYRVAFRLVGAAFVACGVVAWRRRPDSRSGLLMTATGFLLFVEPVFAQLGAPALTTAGDLFEDLWSITIIWLLLTMLSGGHLTTRGEKFLVGLFVLEFALEVVRIAGGGARDGTLASLEGLAVSL